MRHPTNTSRVIRFEVNYEFCVLHRGQKYAQHSSDRWKKPQTEAKTCWSAQLSLTASGRGGAVKLQASMSTHAAPCRHAAEAISTGGCPVSVKARGLGGKCRHAGGETGRQSLSVWDLFLGFMAEELRSSNRMLALGAKHEMRE